MKILSIFWTHCSTAAVVVDGQVVACASEERFSRDKNDGSYPKRAIESVLDVAGLTPGELDVIAVPGEHFDAKYVLCRHSSFSVPDRLREQHEYWLPRIYEKREVHYLDVFKDKVDVDQYPGDWDAVIAFLREHQWSEPAAKPFFQDFRRKTIARHLGVSGDRVVFTPHHPSHAYYAYYGSPVPEDGVLVLTLDGWGDGMNASVGRIDGGRITTVGTSTRFNLGRLYRFTTLILGMKPDEHEYKVMGLAPYARPVDIEGPLEVFRETLSVDGLDVTYRVTPPDHYAYFRERLEGYRFDAIAGALQRYTEELLVGWAENCLKATGARRVCFGGGVGMNVKAMMEIARLGAVDDLFVCPSPADESLPIGAAYFVEHARAPREGWRPRLALRPLRDAYLGPDLEPGDLTRAVRRLAADDRYAVREHADPAHVAAVIASGRIVGRCVGRSEFGARALGNRSILADPRNPAVVRSLNDKVKSRDFWMPFAPSILEERAADYLVNPKSLRAPYMTVAFETTPLAQRDLGAALHPADLTCRPQIVERAVNPGYHALIRAFEGLTGVGGVLNTSMNIHGEPIVQSAADAVDVLERSGLDALILGDAFIEKRR